MKQQLQKPTGAFIGASWLALLIGAIAYLVGVWNSAMQLNEKGYYLVLLMFGLYAAVSLQKCVRDRMEGIPVTGIYFGLSWFSVAMALLFLARHGRPVTYGYLAGRYPLEDYQTVFADEPGSAEMASAARPFTAELVVRLAVRGVAVAPVVLHAGVSSPELHEPPLPERFAVPPATATLVGATRAADGRVVAVGTTVTRALESAADEDGTVVPRAGWTDLVLCPHRPARVVTGLVTGLHAPEASHLLLLEAVAGADAVRRAYDTAVRERYLWHEFGDSSLFLP